MPVVIAHRGAMSSAPENSMAAFDMALRFPVQGFETDLQITEDGELVVFHDETTHRLGCPRAIRDQNAAELKQLDNGAWFHDSFSGEPVLVLPELLERYSRVTHIYLELKCYGQADFSRWKYTGLARLKADLENAGATARVSFLSFDRQILHLLEKQMPAVPRILNVEGTGSPPVRNEDFTCGYSGLCFDIHDLSEQTAETIIQKKHAVMCYGINDSLAWQKAMACHSALVMTDNPAWFFSSRGRS